MSKLNNIPHISCISTTNAQYRQTNFIQQCDKLSITNFTIDIFEPYNSENIIIDGPHVDKVKDNSKGPITSHLNTIYNWLNSSSTSDFILVVEDDISFETLEYWNFTLMELIELLPSDWDCVQLCCIRDSFDNISMKLRTRLNSDWGCQAYLMKRDYAQKLVNKYRLSDNHFKLDINNVSIQTSPGQYQIYDLFPIIENVIFEGIGKVYNIPLFVEDIKNTHSNFAEDIMASNDSVHTQSYNHVTEWWRTIGLKLSLIELLEIKFKDPITVVQLGAHHGNDQLSRYLLTNYKDLSLGLFVEPNPIHIDKLKNCYSKFSNIVIENVAIKPSNYQNNNIEIFYHEKDPDKQVASINIEHVQNHEKFWSHGEIKSFTIPCISLEELLDKYQLINIDWLLIDTEGLEPDILLNLNFTKYNIKRLEFEKLHLHNNKAKILNKLSNEGYYRVASLHEYDWAFEKSEPENNLINKFAIDTENARINFDLGQYYENLGHTASAFSHYLRCAERSDNIDLVYESLIRGYYCFERQAHRDFTASHLLKQAIIVKPKQPEAYLLLVELLYKQGHWYDCYTYSNIALNMCDFTSKNTYISNINYITHDYFFLYKAVSGCYWDKIDEGKNLLNYLIDKQTQLPSYYWSIIESELTKIEQKKQVNLRYDKNQSHRLRIKFPGYTTIEKNYSQCFQDIFVLFATNGKYGGKYLEIGSGDPEFNNNTFLLEKYYNWKGLSIDYNENLVDKFKQTRSNDILFGDATNIRYEQLLDSMHYGTEWDYLQLDCEPPRQTFETLLSLPLHKYKFGIITYEHDYYLDMTRSYRDKSRKYLHSLGYKLIVNNVSFDDNTPFEDWWIHPELIEQSTIDILTKNTITNITNINKYIYQ